MDDFDYLQVNPEIPPAFRIDIKEFLASVDYSDPPIIGLFAYHLIIFLLGFVFRYNRFWRFVIFVYCMVTALLTETIGSILKENWEKIGFSKDYFDEDGVFLLIFLALPPIITCILIVSFLVGSLVERFFFYRRRNQEIEQMRMKRKKKVAKEEEESDQSSSDGEEEEEKKKKKD